MTRSMSLMLCPNVRAVLSRSVADNRLSDMSMSQSGIWLLNGKFESQESCRTLALALDQSMSGWPQELFLPEEGQAFREKERKGMFALAC